jgi:two-component system LytT family response regulator
MMKAFVVDDEPLAVRRLSRMLEESGRVEVAGTSSDPIEASEALPAIRPDVLFLDIQMPGMNGFELLQSLGDDQPLVVFTTAYSQYALKAFEVNSIDYLLKPIESHQLDRALNKLERMKGGTERKPDVNELLRKLAATLDASKPEYPDRLASRLGEKVEFVELARVSHIFAKDKLTYAATATKNFCLDQTISDLEQKLDPRRFVRVHRSTIVNVDFVHELHNWFAGRMLLRLKNEQRTEVTVARDRVKAIKDRLGV